ncbi:hypothetical protein BJ970_006227 [Saccharopolyspora phatthalungensis]|uniref:Uncharacterized protein n=1 Tax=Saccharopolyspora phatthalungensis TaxID=664693 RepID=A0A840QIE1_9PSEU|nr:hypothetical protein [Saccharopolyspora phatthalungensis]
MGSSTLIIGWMMAAKVALGSQPSGMKSAVIRPQAMNAPILGITMLAKCPPHRWIVEPTCQRDGFSSAVFVILNCSLVFPAIGAGRASKAT